MNAGARGDQQHGRDRGGRDGCRQHREQQMTLAGEDAGGEPDPEGDQRQRVDGGVEKLEIELALGDQLGRHSEPVQDPGSDSHASPRPTGQEESAPELCPGDIVVHSPALAVTIELLLRVDDAAPRDDEPELGHDLERDRPEHPFPGHVLEAAQGLFEGRNQLQHQVGDAQQARQLEG
jgi:hypothetical protein